MPGGLVAFILSFLVNRFCIDILGMPRSAKSTRTAPFIEELFKAGILVYLLARGKLTYFVAVRSAAPPPVSAFVIENLRYIQLFPDNPYAGHRSRFSSALAHGTATALTASPGHLLRRRSAVVASAPLLGLLLTLHFLWNNFAYF